jgi:arylformamidase
MYEFGTQVFKEIWDISPLLSEKTAVFPGDQSYQRVVSMGFESGDHFALSSIQSTVHLGAHADAPNHYHKEGKGIDSRDLSLYMGTTQVIETNLPRGERIGPESIKGKKIEASRVLFKTNSFPNSEVWNDDFNSLSPELIDKLHQMEVRLVGIDTPSVDPADDKKLLTHKKIYECDMAIIEGIVLKDVKEGIYQLIALPLPLKDCDASPVRAILLR